MRMMRAAALAALTVWLAVAPAMAQMPWRRANQPRRLEAPSLIVLDAHVDSLRRVLDRGDHLGERIADGQGDIAAWREGGVNVVWFAAWVNPAKYRGEAATQRALRLLGALREQARLYPQHLALCDSAAQCRAAVREGKIAALAGIEGGIAINNDLSLIARFRELGVRRMNLTWKGNLDWAGSSQPLPGGALPFSPNKGLNEFGRQVVREMNRVGMIVDLSHCSDKTFYDALAVSSRPVIVSHSNARALADHPRNVTDDMLRALRDNGGVIGVNFYREYLKSRDARGRWRTPDVETVLDQIDHIVKVTGGTDTVGIGSDWDGDIKPALGLETAAQMPALLAGLERRGYSPQDIRKIAGENFLRVIEANDAPAKP
jgi:membrane dipeptidase